MAEIKSIHDFLMEWINGKFAKRVISALNTEHESRFIDKGAEPEIGEYNWMVARMGELLKEMKMPEGVSKDVKEPSEEEMEALIKKLTRARIKATVGRLREMTPEERKKWTYEQYNGKGRSTNPEADAILEELMRLGLKPPEGEDNAKEAKD